MKWDEIKSPEWDTEMTHIWLGLKYFHPTTGIIELDWEKGNYRTDLHFTEEIEAYLSTEA